MFNLIHKFFIKCEYLLPFLYIVFFETIIFYFCIFLCIAIWFGFVTYTKVKKDISDILPDTKIKVNKLDTYTPKTGDIYLAEWNTLPTNLINHVRYFPSHAGFVWNRKKSFPNSSALIDEEDKDGVFIIEINHFYNIKNYLKSSYNLKKGLRVIDMKSYLKNMDAIVYIRPISIEIPSEKVEQALLKYCNDIKFDTRVSFMTVDSTIGIGWRPYFKNLSDMLLLKLKYFKKDYTNKDFFCSEFVLWFLHILKCIHVTNEQFFKMSPGCFLSFTKKLESFYTKEKNITWDKEFILLKTF